MSQQQGQQPIQQPQCSNCHGTGELCMRCGAASRETCGCRARSTPLSYAPVPCPECKHGIEGNNKDRVQQPCVNCDGIGACTGNCSEWKR